MTRRPRFFSNGSKSWSRCSRECLSIRQKVAIMQSMVLRTVCHTPLTAPSAPAAPPAQAAPPPTLYPWRSIKPQNGRMTIDTLCPPRLVYGALGRCGCFRKIRFFACFAAKNPAQPSATKWNLRFTSLFDRIGLCTILQLDCTILQSDCTILQLGRTILQSACLEPQKLRPIPIAVQSKAILMI